MGFKMIGQYTLLVILALDHLLTVVKGLRFVFCQLVLFIYQKQRYNKEGLGTELKTTQSSEFDCFFE